jgi:NRAMP (natural resistance-associated macrophage protein)-like metal ion transporter
MSYIKAKIKKVWGLLGPGLTTGAADDDPSGIATYSQAGAQFGLQHIWLSPFSLVLMGTVQELCARIALVTGRGLAENIRMHFSKKWLYFCGGLVVFANTLNIGANLGGMASAVQMFFPNLTFAIPLVIIAAVTIYLEVFVSYATYAKYLKWLAMTLLAYVATFLVIHQDLTLLLKATFIPTFTWNDQSIFMIAAILGTTISPYLFFWQTSQEVEDEIGHGDDTVEKRVANGPKGMKQMRFDVWAGMAFSNIVMFAIIAVCASTLFAAGITNITSATEAAEALRPFAGDFAYILFSFGIISTGLLAIPVLAGSSAYIFAETFKWNEGLYRKPKDAVYFYGIISLSIVVGLLFNFFGINPIKALIYTSVANAMVAPVGLVFILLLAGNKEVMGAHVAGKWGKIVGWGTTILMTGVAIAVMAQIF